VQGDWNDVRVLVIVEVSFLSPAQLFAISTRLGIIFTSTRHLPFAGLYVILAGNPFQLGLNEGKTLWPRDGQRPLSAQENWEGLLPGLRQVLRANHLTRKLRPVL